MPEKSGSWRASLVSSLLNRLPFSLLPGPADILFPGNLFFEPFLLKLLSLKSPGAFRVKSETARQSFRYCNRLLFRFRVLFFLFSWKWWPCEIADRHMVSHVDQFAVLRECYACLKSPLCLDSQQHGRRVSTPSNSLCQFLCRGQQDPCPPQRYDPLLAHDRICPATHAVIKEFGRNNLHIRIQRTITENSPYLIIFQDKGLFTRRQEDFLDVRFPHISPPRFL